jgi:hypothetical protein
MTNLPGSVRMPHFSGALATNKKFTRSDAMMVCQRPQNPWGGFGGLPMGPQLTAAGMSAAKNDRAKG